jgi:hypothetical protein
MEMLYFILASRVDHLPQKHERIKEIMLAPLSVVVNKNIACDLASVVMCLLDDSYCPSRAYSHQLHDVPGLRI